MSLNELVHLCGECLTLNTLKDVINNDGKCVNCDTYQVDLPSTSPVKKAPPLPSQTLASSLSEVEKVTRLGKFPLSKEEEKKDAFQHKVEEELKKELKSLGVNSPTPLLHNDGNNAFPQQVKPEFKNELPPQGQGSLPQEKKEEPLAHSKLDDDWGSPVKSLKTSSGTTEKNSHPVETDDWITAPSKEDAAPNKIRETTSSKEIPSASDTKPETPTPQKEEKKIQINFSSSFDDFVGIPSLSEAP